MSESNWFRRMTKYWTPGWLILGVLLFAIAYYELASNFLAGLWWGLWVAYPIVREAYDRGRMVGRQKANEADSEE